MGYMENENDRGPGGPRPGDGWASGAGAGPGGFGHRTPGENPDGAGRHEAPPEQYGGYGHAVPAQERPGPWQPTTAFPAQQGPPPGQPGYPGPPPGQPGQPGRFEPAQQGQPPKKSGRGLIAAGVVAAMLVSGGIGGWVGASVSGGTGGTGLSSPINSAQPASEAPDGSVEAVADKVLPSVVSIEVTAQRGRGEGSGVILSGDGLIITNSHVVGMAAEGGRIGVRFNDGSEASAEIVGVDPTTDIAVIKADTTRPLSPIALGTSSTLDEGQAVAAVGSPLGLSGTITTGIVSALERPVRAGGAQSDQSTVINAVQTDAAVNPGNSGGALVNMNGDLVGINSAIASTGAGTSGSIGLGFAIPVDQARRIADQLIKQGFATHAVLGVTVSDVPDGDGALVRGTEPGGAAVEAGLSEGAVISQVGDRVVESSDALVAAIRSQAPGETVSVTYAAREGEEPTTVDVVLGETR